MGWVGWGWKWGGGRGLRKIVEWIGALIGIGNSSPCDIVPESNSFARAMWVSMRERWEGEVMTDVS